MNDSERSPQGLQAIASRGARLRAAREQAGLSVEEMATRLRLSQRQVIALENDEEAALPPAPYMRGFVRNYARTLGRDPAEFEPERTTEERPSPQMPPPSLALPTPQRELRLESRRASANRRWLMAALGALVLALVLSWIRREHIRAASDLIAGQAVPSLARLGILVGSREGPAAPPESAAAPAAGTSPDAPQPPAPMPAEAAGEASAPGGDATHDSAAVPVDTAEGARLAAKANGAQSLPAAGPAVDKLSASLDASAPPLLAVNGPARHLELEFDADSWVEVRDDNNQVLLSGLSRAGDRRDLETHGPVRIVVGNAPATRVNWNGHPVDLSGFTKVTVARLTLDPAAEHP